MPPNRPHPQRRHFTRSLSSIRPASLIGPVLLLFLFTLLAFVAFTLSVMPGEGESVPASLGAVLQAVWAEVAHVLIAGVVALVVGALLLTLAMRQARRTSLVIDSTGIHCHPPGHGLGMLFQDPRRHTWRTNRENIRQAILLPSFPSANPHGTDTAQALAQWHLQLHTESGVHEVRPWLWLETGGDDHRLSLLSAMRRPDSDTIREWIHKAPLITALRDSGIEGTEAERDTTDPLRNLPAGSGFDLTSHKGMLAQLGLFFAAGGYALVDGLVLRPWEALGTPPIAPFAATAIVGLGLVGALGRAAPITERLGVGALCVAALTAAVYPSLLRYNAASDPTPVMHEYRMTAPGLFEPDDSRLPPIDLRHLDLHDYWQSLDPPAHEFRLYRGELDFWQFDRQHLFERTQTFYADQG